MSERDAFVIHTVADRVDDRVRIVLTVDLPEGVHIEPHHPAEPYLIPTVVDVDGLSDVTVTYPAPVVKDLGWNDLTLTVLEGSVPFVVTGLTPAQTDQVRGTITCQPCIGGACLPPRTVRWQSPVRGSSAYSVLRALAS